MEMRFGSGGISFSTIRMEKFALIHIQIVFGASVIVLSYSFLPVFAHSNITNCMLMEMSKLIQLICCFVNNLLKEKQNK